MAIQRKYHKIGIVGFGVRGQQLASAVIHQLPEFGKVAVCAEIRKNPVFPEDISTRCPDLRVYEDYKKLLKDKEIDTVLVTTYETTHRQITEDAIRAGKAVLCDKPIVPDMKEAEALYRFVTSRECFFQVGLNLPSFPVPLKLKELLDSGKIGKVIASRGACDVGVNFGRDIILNKFGGKRGNFITAKLTHDTDLMQYLLGTYAEEVWGKTANFLWRRNGEKPDTDDTGVMAGVMHNGVLFSEWLTSCGSKYERKFHFFGTKGELFADLHSEEITFISSTGQQETIPAPNLNGGSHNGADKVMLTSFLDYVDSGVKQARWPERILSSVMVAMSALEGKHVKTGEWYRRITGEK